MFLTLNISTNVKYALIHAISISFCSKHKFLINIKFTQQFARVRQMTILLKVSTLGTSTLATTTTSQGKDAKCHPPRYGIFWIQAYQYCCWSINYPKCKHCNEHLGQKTKNIKTTTMSDKLGRRASIPK